MNTRIYNENLDRAIQSFSVPLGCGITVSNLGFHAPLNHPGFPNDGTLGDAGFSNAAWTSNQTTSGELELGNLCPEPERERHSLGHVV